MPTKSEAIKKFLTSKGCTIPYDYAMECQVNVAQDMGERIDGEFQGRHWNGWTDGLTTWKSFRIPWNANTVPEYEDTRISFDLAEHAEGIGMTGWDWQGRVSRWVAFDFDAIAGHSEKHSSRLTNEELETVRTAAMSIPWVTTRYSAGGAGLHLYVYLNDVPTANHTEHASLARSILGKMAALTGYDFASKVDNCGGNMWVWHRKAERGNPNCLKLIKQGLILHDVPPNWRDHIAVVSANRTKRGQQPTDASSIEGLTAQYNNVPLDASHKELIHYLEESGAVWWWDQDKYILVTHTYWLNKAKEDIPLKGIFATSSPGTNRFEQNCFAIPQRDGAWIVRRFTPGVQEHASWDQDNNGWTRCHLNVKPDLLAACRAYGGIEDLKGAFCFMEAEVASKAAQAMGISVVIPPAMAGRPSKLASHKDGRLVMVIDYHQGDTMPGWLQSKDSWTKILTGTIRSPNEENTANYDDVVRHLVNESHEDAGWVLSNESMWHMEPLAHIRVALASLGYATSDITSALGKAVFQCWQLINQPFSPEYPGDRKWNRNAAQFRYLRSDDTDNLHYPTWKKILEHCGESLDNNIRNDPWCQVNGLKTGADYLKCWIASLFQEPMKPLPYLFFYGPQDSGKSVFHESISLLVSKGVQRADAALISTAGFNGELLGAILCVVEEIDLNNNKTAYAKIKDWVTGRDLLIHPKGATPYTVVNTTHWVQCGNNHKDCPVFPGDTRITMIHVDTLNPLELIPKTQLIELLKKEAPDFLSAVMSVEIPEANSRLNIPVINTDDKTALQELNQTELESFLKDKLITSNGQWIKFSDLKDRFYASLTDEEQVRWSGNRIAKELPSHYIRGRSRENAQVHIGNMSWREDAVKTGEKYIKQGDYLRLVRDDDKG